MSHPIGHRPIHLIEQMKSLDQLQKQLVSQFLPPPRKRPEHPKPALDPLDRAAMLASTEAIQAALDAFPRSSDTAAPDPLSEASHKGTGGLVPSGSPGSGSLSGAASGVGPASVSACPSMASDLDHLVLALDLVPRVPKPWR